MFCPEWLIGCSAAYTAKGFLYSESSINGFARKFAKGLSEKYEDVYFEEYKAVINSFRENKPIEKLATLQQSHHVMQVIEAIKLSSSLGSRISLPIH